MTATLDRVRRDLGESRSGSDRSSARGAAGAVRRARTAPEPPLGGPPRSRRAGVSTNRRAAVAGLTDPELWEISQCRARAKRLAAEPGTLPQARVASATLVVAAVAAALPVSGGAHGRAKSSGSAEVRVELLRVGSRGPAVVKLQKRLGITADGSRAAHPRLRFERSRSGTVCSWTGSSGPRRARPLRSRAGEDHPGLVGRAGAACLGRARRRTLRAGEQSRRPQVPEEARADRRRDRRTPDSGPSASGGRRRRRSRALRRRRLRRRLLRRPRAGASASPRSRSATSIPYRWGGESPRTGFDCSGFVMYVFSRVGISLPRVVSAQYRVGKPVKKARSGRATSSSTASATTASTSAVAASCTPRTRATSSRSRAFTSPGTTRAGSAPASRLEGTGAREKSLVLLGFHSMRTIWNGSINFGLVNIPIGLAVRSSARTCRSGPCTGSAARPSSRSAGAPSTSATSRPTSSSRAGSSPRASS